MAANKPEILKIYIFKHEMQRNSSDNGLLAIYYVHLQVERTHRKRKNSRKHITVSKIQPVQDLTTHRSSFAAVHRFVENT